MNIYETMKTLYINPKDDPSGYEKLMQDRAKAKDKLWKELQKKLYLNDLELSAVFEVIERAEKDIENITKKIDYKNCTDEDMENMQETILDIQDKMGKDVIKKIKTIMDAKLKRAKEIFGNKKEAD
jgi:signal recognition particle GTPase